MHNMTKCFCSLSLCNCFKTGFLRWRISHLVNWSSQLVYANYSGLEGFFGEGPGVADEGGCLFDFWRVFFRVFFFLLKGGVGNYNIGENAQYILITKQTIYNSKRTVLVKLTQCKFYMVLLSIC